MSLVDQVIALRSRVGISRHSLQLQRWPAADGLQALDVHVATNLSIREAQFRQCLCLDAKGQPTADLLVGFFQGKLYSLSEGSLPFAGESDQRVVLGIDGPFAWELLAAWDTPGAIGLPYLGAYSPREGITVLRAGRTGEYGYLLFVPAHQADAIEAELIEAGRAMEAIRVEAAALRHCSLENWVFELSRDGGHGLDALELQLTWRLDLQKHAVGLDAVRAHRKEGLRRRITAIRAAESVAVGASVMLGEQAIGTVLATAPDLFGSEHRVLAVLALPYAQAGIDGYTIEGRPCSTLSAPWVLNRSLFVNPQRHGWTSRHEIELPDGMQWAPTPS